MEALVVEGGGYNQGTTLIVIIFGLKSTPVITKRNWKQEKDITLRTLNVSTKLLLEERRKCIERKANKEKRKQTKSIEKILQSN